MPLVLLDRDGVINEDSPAYIKRPSEWLPIPGSLEAISRLNRIGDSVAICTNQSGLARRLFTIKDLDAIHEAMRRALVPVGGHIDAIFYCPHAPEERCSCRKPEPGLLVRAMYELRAAPEQTAYVGDSISDMQAALMARCTPVLVRTGNGAASELQARAMGIDQIFDDLAGAVDWLAIR